jgi:hypothetical protein
VLYFFLPFNATGTMDDLRREAKEAGQACFQLMTFGEFKNSKY